MKRIEREMRREGVKKKRKGCSTRQFTPHIYARERGASFFFHALDPLLVAYPFAFGLASPHYCALLFCEKNVVLRGCWYMVPFSSFAFLFFSHEAGKKNDYRRTTPKYVSSNILFAQKMLPLCL